MTRHGTGPLSPEELQEWYAVPPEAQDGTWVRGSFITSLDGRAVGPDSSSRSLNEGSEGDRAVFLHLRDWADAVVVGAGTVREEGYGPIRRSNLVVVTSSGALPDKVLDTKPHHQEVVVLGGEGRRVPPQEVMAELAERGWRRIVVEGGPALFAPWVAEGLVDELCITVRPVLVGGVHPLVIPADSDLGDRPVGTATHLLSWDEDVLVRTRLS